MAIVCAGAPQAGQCRAPTLRTATTMLDPRYPWLAIGFLIVIATGALLQRASVAFGLFKDPLLARFRTYGPETPFSPLARFLNMLGVWSLLVASMLDTLTTYRHTSWGYAPVICFSVMLMAFAGSVITRNSDSLRHALPPWYGELMQQTTRQERRHLAYAWLRIPRKMRWRLNADQASFRVFVELVRLTSYYGARDRDDPWAIWQ